MKGKLVRAALTMLTLCMLTVSTLSPAYALSWDGSSSGGGGGTSPTSPGGYAVRYANAESCVVGYRFSVINNSGTTKGLVIDVYKGSGGFNNPKFSSKYNKADLIRRQNNGWSTSTSTYLCIKQSELGISLPAPSGMGVWQEKKSNLNPILREISPSLSVDNLIYGDKVLVEPIIEIAIAGTYHSFTVTEMALYGKHMLGVNSNGGSSSNSGSWGFIATYTNKNFPNLLRASNGYGIWTGVSSALTSQATFYDIINKGYGVGVAFTQTQNKPYRLDVNGLLDGVSSGNTEGYGTFDVYINGVLVYNDVTDCYYSVNTGDKYEIKGIKAVSGKSYGGVVSGSLSGTIAGNTSLRLEFFTAYKLDVNGLLDGVSSGNTEGYGTFDVYVNGSLKYNDVTDCYCDLKIGDKYEIKDIKAHTGKSYKGLSSGSLSGTIQGNASARLKFTTNTLSIYYNANGGDINSDTYALWSDGNVYQKSDQVTIVTKGTYNDPINTRYGVTDGATFGLYRTGYKWLGWNTKADGTGITIGENDLGVVPTDFTSDILTGDASVTLYAQWTLNTYTIVFNGNGATGGSTASMSMTYNEAKNLTANGFTRTGYTFICWNTKADGSGTRYSDGQSVKNLTSVDGGTVILYAQWEKDLVLEPIEPNAAYRETTEVITSYWLINDSDKDYTPADYVTLRFDIQRADGSLYQSITKQNVVVPANEKNLLYIKWEVPEGLEGSKMIIQVSLVQDGEDSVLASKAYTTSEYTICQTPDTTFEYEAPASTYSSVPSTQSATVTWSEFVYEDGDFVEKTYQFRLLTQDFDLIPDSESAFIKGWQWSMKSGYGFSCEGAPTYLGTALGGYLQPTIDSYTIPQYAYALYPEYGYAYGEETCTTLTRGSNPTLPEFMDYGKVHFTPIWYPDGDYTVAVVSSDCWTPMGMVKATTTQTLQIEGSVYDDWYVGRR